MQYILFCNNAVSLIGVILHYITCTKLWELKDNNLKAQFRENVLDNVRPVESVQEWWEETNRPLQRY